MKTPRLKTSATQINEFLTCKRRWVASYVLGIKQPQTEAMAFGETGHKYLENYMKYGTPPDAEKPWQFTKESKIRYPGLSAKKAIKHIPKPGTARAEHGFSFVINDIEFIGYIDLEYFDEHKNIYLTDYKFVSSYQSALDSDSLQTNVQTTIYAAKSIFEHKVENINLKWVYILSTKNPSVRTITSGLTKKQTSDQLKKLLDICEEMIELRDSIKKEKYTEIEILNEIQPTIESCSRYGGCYYINMCNLTPEQLMQGDFKEMDNDLSSKLKGLGLDQYIKKDAPKKDDPPEVKGPPPSNGGTKTTAKGTMDLSQFMKQPTVHTEQKPEERAPVEVVQTTIVPPAKLNAPEHYTQEVKEVVAGLSDEDKSAFLRVVKAVLDRI